MKFDDLKIPSEVANKLNLVKLFVDDNYQYHKDKHTFSELVDELKTAIEESGIKIEKQYKDCQINGPCIIGKDVKIQSGNITGPCIIGSNCEIDSNVLIRPGTILGPNVRIGHNVEIKESIIGSHSSTAHSCYIGNSLIGKSCSISANVTISAWRFDESNVRLWISQNRYINTNCEKLGLVAGNNIKIGAGSNIMPGTSIGSNTTIWPNIVIAKYIPENSIVKIETGINRGEDNPPNKFDLLKASIESYHKENDRFWRRTAVFGYIHAALLTAFAAYGNNFSDSGKFFLSLFGFLTALSWFQTVRMGKYYFERDECDAEEFIKSNAEYSNILRRWTKIPIPKRPFLGIRPTTCIKIVSFLTIILWLIIFIDTIGDFTIVDFINYVKSAFQRNIVSPPSLNL